MASNDLINTIIAEAGGEGEAGIIAATWAIAQRAAAHGQTMDQVIRSGFDGFSNPGSGAIRAQQNQGLRRQVESIIQGVQQGTIPNPVPGADHFLSGTVMPSWARGMDLVDTIGGHRFYASGNVPMSAQGLPVPPAELPEVATARDVVPPAPPVPATMSPTTSALRNLQPASTDVASLYAGIYPATARDPITTSDLFSGPGIAETVQRTQAQQDPALASALQSYITRSQAPQLSSGPISYAGQERGGGLSAPATRAVTPMPVGAPQSYAGQEGGRSSSPTVPMPLPRPVTASDIARAEGTTVASIPSTYANPAATPVRLPELPAAGSSGIGQSPATRAVQSVPMPAQPSAATDTARRATAAEIRADNGQVVPRVGVAQQVAAPAGSFNPPLSSQNTGITASDRVRAAQAPATQQRLAAGVAQPAPVEGIVGPQQVAQIGVGLDGTRGLPALVPPVPMPPYRAVASNLSVLPPLPRARPVRAAPMPPLPIARPMQAAAMPSLRLPSPLRVLVNGANEVMQAMSTPRQQTSAVQAFRDQGMSAAQAYDAANAAAAQRARDNAGPAGGSQVYSSGGQRYDRTTGNWV